MNQDPESRPPFPPFDATSAAKKARMAEDGWNRKDPIKISQAYSADSRWRNRSLFLEGRDEIVEFLTHKWEKELDYRLVKEVWSYVDNRIAIRFVYEWHDASGQWYRSHGNENWEFDSCGLMKQRHASINDVEILKEDRKLVWEGDVRPSDFPSLSELGL